MWNSDAGLTWDMAFYVAALVETCFMTSGYVKEWTKKEKKRKGKKIMLIKIDKKDRREEK